MKRKLERGLSMPLLNCSEKNLSDCFVQDIEEQIPFKNNYFNILIYKSIILSCRFILQLWLSRKFCDANKWFKIKKRFTNFSTYCEGLIKFGFRFQVILNS